MGIGELFPFANRPGGGLSPPSARSPRPRTSCAAGSGSLSAMPLRSGCFVAAFLGCIAALAGEAQRAGLLPNPSFEQAGTDGLPVGFRKYVYGAQPTITFDSQVKKDGRQSLRVSAEQPSDTAIAQDIQLKPG